LPFASLSLTSARPPADWPCPRSPHHLADQELERGFFASLKLGYGVGIVGDDLLHHGRQLVGVADLLQASSSTIACGGRPVSNITPNTF